MADAPVLGAGSPECGFKSHLPHHLDAEPDLFWVQHFLLFSYTDINFLIVLDSQPGLTFILYS